jgi:hypothetical protein
VSAVFFFRGGAAFLCWRGLFVLARPFCVGAAFLCWRGLFVLARPFCVGAAFLCWRGLFVLARPFCVTRLRWGQVRPVRKTDGLG